LPTQKLKFPLQTAYASSSCPGTPPRQARFSLEILIFGFGIRFRTGSLANRLFMTTGKFIFGILLVVLGLSILIGFSFFQFAVGAVLIWIGVRMLYGHGERHGRDHDHRTGFGDVARSASAEEMSSEVFVFSLVNKEFRTENFTYGKVVMVFAGGELDLSQVKTTQEEVVMEVVVVFGGAKLIIPKHWKVVSEGAAIFGGYDNRTEPGTGPSPSQVFQGKIWEGEVTLRLKGSAVFGGVEIIN
jgi:predicted membrane protein